MGVNTYRPPMARAEGRGVRFERRTSRLSSGGGLRDWRPYLGRLGGGASVAVSPAFPRLFPWISAEFLGTFADDP